ncbi:DUF362 domain-containing protein [Limisphaera sp. VF-2]|uniref:DUF362 domain-containing protein n=1 Tax=Limisphaera sp. VF-2 TaxID=3400418 RepID=UPI003C228D69
MTAGPTALVSLTKLATYEPTAVLQAMRTCLEPFGGMATFVKPGQKVLLKPNLLGPFPADQAVTTHPSIVRAAAILVREAGGRPYIGDSPAVGRLSQVARVTGMLDVVAETGAPLLELEEPGEFEVPGHGIFPRLVLARALSQVDVVISLPKLKTHSQMILTGALKNQFGCVPGLLKSEWHFRLQERKWLAALLLDIHRAIRPCLAIMDAVVAMEGPGPSAGHPRSLGVLLAGTDFVAVDAVACHLIGLSPAQVPSCRAAHEQGVGETDLQRLRLVGPDWRTLRVSDFQPPPQPAEVLRLLPLPPALLRGLRRQWTLRPVILPGRCTRCGICEERCPVRPSAIHPRACPSHQLDDRRCIRCYCCHEFCPAHAIVLRSSRTSRWLPLRPVARGVNRLLGWLGALRQDRTH